MKITRLELAAAAALLLAACGGGGGDTPPPGPYAVRAAQTHLLNDTHSWALSGTGPNGQPFTITMAFAPLPPAPFPIGGALGARSLQTYTVQQGGVSSSAGPTYFFDATSLAIAGSDYGDGTCSIATSNAAVPLSASVGASGPLFSVSDRGGCTAGAAAESTTTTQWSLESDSGVVLLCWNSTLFDLAGTAEGTLASCVQAAPDGALGTKARLTITALGARLDARNF